MDAENFAGIVAVSSAREAANMKCSGDSERHERSEGSRERPEFDLSEHRAHRQNPAAKNSAAVKPAEVAQAMVSSSRQAIRRGRWKPAARARATAPTIPGGRPTSALASIAHVPVSYSRSSTPAFTSPNRRSTT
jgi:hypothetical protein